MLEEGGERRRAGGGRRGAGRGGGEAEEWEQRRKREDGAGSGGRAKGEGVQPERAEQRGASEGRRQPPGRGAGLWSTAAGVWSLSNTRDIRGLGFLWFGQWGGVRVFGFLGVCFVVFFWLFRGLGIWAVKILLLYLYNDYKLIIEFGMEVKKSVTTHVGAKAACHFEA